MLCCHNPLSVLTFFRQNLGANNSLTALTQLRKHDL